MCQAKVEMSPFAGRQRRACYARAAGEAETGSGGEQPFGAPDRTLGDAAFGRITPILIIRRFQAGDASHFRSFNFDIVSPWRFAASAVRWHRLYRRTLCDPGIFAS